MTFRTPLFLVSLTTIWACLAPPQISHAQAAAPQNPADDFRTADTCSSCHDNLKTAKGEDISFVSRWSASIMANAARDPYWQGSVRREVLDHPESSEAIQTECARCHMPLQVLMDKAHGSGTQVFSRLPFHSGNEKDASAVDGVSCTVCHQIQAAGLGTPATFSGNFTVAPPGTNPRPLFGPWGPDSEDVNNVHVSSGGYSIEQAAQIRDAALCGSCHTLYTTTLGPRGKQIAQLPEQMPYLEWLHSSYHGQKSCQQCHMPAVAEPVAVASLLANPRDGVSLHTFPGANILMLNMLATHHDELAVAAEPDGLAAAMAETKSFLQSQAARVSLGPAQLAGGELAFTVRVENLTGHKLPTAYPSRRAWLHVVVTAADGHVVFESGKLNPDGSIAGNANDADPKHYSPHYSRISDPNQVEIFEPILGDSEGRVTTGLISATRYIKDNRILPAGFDKDTASPDIAVRGEAAQDPNFVAGSCSTHYAIPINGAAGPFHIAAELYYQPVGYRWAHNLAKYRADEPQRFVRYYEQAAAQSAIVLAGDRAVAGKQ